MKTFTRKDGAACVQVDGWLGEVHRDGDKCPCEFCAVPAPGTWARFVLRVVIWGYAALAWASRRWLAYPESAHVSFAYMMPEEASRRLARWEPTAKAEEQAR